MASHVTPDDVEHTVFFIRWWQEILSGSVMILTGWLLKAKGKKLESVIVPISEEEVEHRIIICKQAVIMAVHEEMDRRDEKLFAHVETQNEKLLSHIKDIIRK
jgi:hypothetical protein